MKIIFCAISFTVIFVFIVASSQVTAFEGYKEFTSYYKSLKDVMTSRNYSDVCGMKSVVISFFVLHKRSGGFLDDEISDISRGYEIFLNEKLSPSRAVMLDLKRISKEVYTMDLDKEEFYKFIEDQYSSCIRKNHKFLSGKE